MESVDSRKEKLHDWLVHGCGLSNISMLPLVGDASFRRYYRVSNGVQTFIAMDAPPPETCQPFVVISRALRQLRLHTPEVYTTDLDQGFLLLSDFGDDTYLKVLSPSNANVLYQHALDALFILQGCRTVIGREIPPFTQEFMWQEWAWHKEWLLEKLLGESLSAHDLASLDQCYGLLVEEAAAQPQVFMHRDYHSANLMCLTDSEQVGILDFQDAFIGPVTYDVVSLLRDCYISWPESQVAAWTQYYYDLLKTSGVIQVSAEEFTRWVDWMGLQRQLKALLTFARKQVRDNQPQYLQHIPRTLKNLQTIAARYTELKVLQHYLNDIVQPSFERVHAVCEQ